MEDVKRPTGKETDEDLLVQQESFLKSKTKPGVNLAKKYEQKKTEEKQPVPQNDKIVDCDVKDELEIQEKNIISDVQEQDVALSEPFTFLAATHSPLDIHDLVIKDIKQSKFKASKKSQSIFTQLLKKEDVKDEERVIVPSPPGFLVDGSGLPENERDKELKNIHEENVAKISSMSKEEILMHQSQIMKHLDPNIIKFIQNKNKKKTPTQLSSNSYQSSQNKILKFNNQFIHQDGSSDKILKKEGKGDCDALLLEKALESEIQVNENKLPSHSCQIKNIEIPVETKELLKGRDKGHWKSMNKIEKEKLEWMSNLPKANPIDLKTGFSARFDFEGKLLAHDLETPTYKGLHHHGEEPEVAGYTLEELFLLARSTLQSQRITALHTISHILDNYWCGLMDGCFDDPLLPVILEAGIVPLLRWALDDISITSVAATISAIHSLLISKADEICLQRVFCWLHGHIMPQFEPQDLDEPNLVLEELTDADLIKLDVVKAFLRMDILPRFMYIIQALQPPPLVCKLIIEICAHLAQHSIESAVQVTNHPRLLNLIFTKFLPLKWQFIDVSKLTDTVDFNYPLPAAMKLMRIVASSSWELAIQLVNDHDIFSHIAIYLTLQPGDGKVTLQDIQELMIESLKTFQVLLCYGLGYDVFLELFPIFLRQMDFCLSLDLNFERSKHMQDFNYATHLFKVLEAVALLSAKQDNWKTSAAAVYAIFKKALICLKKWLWQFSQDKPHDHALMLLASNMNFISACYEKCHEGLVCEVQEPCSETKEVFKVYLLPCIKSKVFQNLLEKLQSCSLLLNSNESGNKRDSKTIVSLGSILWKGDIVPILQEGSPVPLLLAILKFCILQKQFFNDSDNQFVEVFLQNKSISVYLRNIVAEKLNVSNWFMKYESFLIFHFLKLASLVKPCDKIFWHKVATTILLTFKTPHECLVEDLFDKVIFSQEFLLLEDFNKKFCEIPFISKFYAAGLLNLDELSHSRNIMHGNTDVISLAAASNSPFLLSTDWCYSPILKHYKYSTQSSQNNRDLAPEISSELMSYLQWIYICHESCSYILKDIPGSVEFSYLCLLFLLDENFYSTSKNHLEKCLFSLLKHKKVKLAKINWPNLSEFDDLYLQMLNQFEAVSYGDELFGNFILFPLQQGYPARWKKVFLNDFDEVLQFLRVPLSKLLVPLQSYLEPFETEIEVIRDYYKVLISGILTQQRCPLVYLMAVHHINHFLFTNCNENVKSQKSLLFAVLKTKNKKVKEHVLLYSKVDINTDCGFSVKQELSQSDQTHLSNIIGFSVNL